MGELRAVVLKPHDQLAMDRLNHRKTGLMVLQEIGGIVSLVITVIWVLAWGINRTYTPSYMPMSPGFKHFLVAGVTFLVVFGIWELWMALRRRRISLDKTLLARKRTPCYLTDDALRELAQRLEAICQEALGACILDEDRLAAYSLLYRGYTELAEAHDGAEHTANFDLVLKDAEELRARLAVEKGERVLAK